MVKLQRVHAGREVHKGLHWCHSTRASARTKRRRVVCGTGAVCAAAVQVYDTAACAVHTRGNRWV